MTVAENRVKLAALAVSGLFDGIRRPAPLFHGSWIAMWTIKAESRKGLT